MLGLLAERIRAGDAPAERELIERYSRGVRAILRHAGADRFLQDDLHQDTFRIALEKIRNGDLRDASGLSGFIASLARHLATDHFRRKARSASTDPADLDRLQAPQKGALERLIESEHGQSIRRLLDELGVRRDREILHRYYVSSEDKADLCEEWGLSSLQFNRVLFRARKRYRALYERSFGSLSA
jgi:RNA polymerase sigma-70 factor (ECF subfamily)